MRRNGGVVIGLVKSVDDPDGQGRIQLGFPQLPGGPSSSWAPVASLLAGKNRGAFFMPEVDDEVLVAFENGDFAHPFIVGFLWNGVDQPPETDPKNRIILTPGGNTLRFEDGEGSKKVILKSSSGHKLALDDSTGVQTVTLESSGGLKIELNDVSQSITLQGGGRIITLSKGMVQIT